MPARRTASTTREPAISPSAGSAFPMVGELGHARRRIDRDQRGPGPPTAKATIR